MLSLKIGYFMKSLRAAFGRFSYRVVKPTFKVRYLALSEEELKKEASQKEDRFLVFLGITGLLAALPIALCVVWVLPTMGDSMAAFFSSGSSSAEETPFPMAMNTFWAWTLALGLVPSAGVMLSKFLWVIRGVKLPSAFQPYLDPATQAITSITFRARDPFLNKDSQALDLAREACKLYDKIILELDAVYQTEPDAFIQSSAPFSISSKSQEVNAWLDQTLKAANILGEIDFKLAEIAASRKEEEVLSRRSEALSEIQSARASNFRPLAEASLANITLREEMIKNSVFERPESAAPLLNTKIGY